MSLSRVLDYLRQRRRASVQDLALALDSEASAVRAMLERLAASGRVRRLPGGAACGGGCSKCDPAAVEVYEWTGD